MKHSYIFTLFALCAALLISGCNSDKPAETSAATEEVTTTATSDVTTSADSTTITITPATTTSPTITTAAEEEPSNGRKYYIDHEITHIDDDYFRIFEEAFYGTWTWIDGSKETFTYSESPFTFENAFYPHGIVETDDYYAITYVAGGVGGCYFIEKSAPDVMYNKELWYETNSRAYIIINEDYNAVYTGRANYNTPSMTEHGEISVFGMEWLEYSYGWNFAARLDHIYQIHSEDYITDNEGRHWIHAGALTLPLEKRYLIERGEDRVVFTMLYRDAEEYRKYMQGDESTEPTERQLALTLEKDESGSWELTEMFRADFDGYSELIEKYFLGVWRSESVQEYIIGKDPENKYVDLLRGRIRYVKKTGNTVELSTYNYIGDEYRLVIDLNDPDTALSYDVYAEASESDYVPEKFTRIDTAEMYSDTGKLDDYIDSMLYIRYNYFHGFGQEIESYSNNPLVPGYTVLEEHSAERLVWVEPFEDTASEEHKVVYIRYEEVPDGEYWKVDKWEIIDNYDVKRR